MAKLARLMRPDLPQFIDISRFADEQRSLEGGIELRELGRLRQLTGSNEGLLDFTLRFARDAGGRVVINGEYSVDLTMVCQRCLEPFAVTVAEKIAVGVANDREQAQALAEHLEPLQVSNMRLDVREFLEEEVLLGLPIAPVHAEKECPASAQVRALKPEKKNPFAVLKGKF